MTVATDSWSSTGGPCVDLSDDPNATARQDVYTITPQTSGNDEVWITAQVRMTTPLSYLNATDIMGQIFVMQA